MSDTDANSPNAAIADLRETLGKVEDAANAAFPNSASRYTSTYVLLLSWEYDDLGISQEVRELSDMFMIGYGYEVESWRIPATDSDDAVVQKLFEIRQKNPSEKHLVIIYYAGHGYLNSNRQLMWSCYPPDADTTESDNPTVQWFAHAPLFANTKSDVLFILDCCSAGGAGFDARNGTKEIIAACGFETAASADRGHSFTHALIRALESSQSGPSFSVAALHYRVLQQQCRWSPESDYERLMEHRKDGRMTDIERRKSPIYMALNTKQTYITRSIVLPTAGRRISGLNSAEHVASDKDSDEYTDVLFSVRLSPGSRLTAEDIAAWLKELPILALSIRVYGLVHDNASLVLLAVPVPIWSLVSKDPRLHFLEFVKTPNLLFGKEYLLDHEFATRMGFHSHSQECLQDILAQSLPQKHPTVLSTALRQTYYSMFFSSLEDTRPTTDEIRYAELYSHSGMGYGLRPPQKSNFRPGMCVSYNTEYWRTAEEHWRIIGSLPEISKELGDTMEYEIFNNLETKTVQRGPIMFGLRLMNYQSNNEASDYQYMASLKFEGISSIVLPIEPIVYTAFIESAIERLISFLYSNMQRLADDKRIRIPDHLFLITGTYSTKCGYQWYEDLRVTGEKQINIYCENSDVYSGRQTGRWIFPDIENTYYWSDNSVLSFEGVCFTFDKVDQTKPLSLPYTTIKSVEEGVECTYKVTHTLFIHPKQQGSLQLI